MSSHARDVPVLNRNSAAFGPRSGRHANSGYSSCALAATGFGDEPSWGTALRALSAEVEPIEVHDLFPRGHEITDEFLLGVILCVDFRERSELRVIAEDEVDGRPVHLSLPVA